jgi:hypothetical protein
MKKTRRRYDRAFKISVVAELESGKPLAQIAREHRSQSAFSKDDWSIYAQGKSWITAYSFEEIRETHKIELQKIREILRLAHPGPPALPCSCRPRTWPRSCQNSCYLPVMKKLILFFAALVCICMQALVLAAKDDAISWPYKSQFNPGTDDLG